LLWQVKKKWWQKGLKEIICMPSFLKNKWSDITTLTQVGVLFAAVMLAIALFSALFNVFTYYYPHENNKIQEQNEPHRSKNDVDKLNP